MGTLDLPSIQSASGGWKVETEGAAGGYAYLLPEKERRRLVETNLLWSWSVDQFPVTRATSPSDKAADDYALRIGLLIRGNGELQMPQSLAEAALKSVGKISYILFYSATERPDWNNRCFRNPYNDRVFNCLRLASGKRSEVRPSPYSDLSTVLSLSDESLSKLEAAGIWIFADSDNSKTKSKARLYDLKVGGAGGG